MLKQKYINKIFNSPGLIGMKELPKESIDLIFTDPPYYQNRAQNIKSLKNHKDVITEFEFDQYKTEEDYLYFLEKILSELYRIAKKGASGYIFCSDDYVSFINRIIEKVGFKLRKVIHWHKTNPFPAIKTRKMFANSMELIIHFSKSSPSTWNFKSVNQMHNFIETGKTSFPRIWTLDDDIPHNFIETPICMGRERTNHRTQKPLSLCQHFIEISTNPNDIIIDPFMGSGTTAVAALNKGRKFIGYEIKQQYCEIAEKRLINFISESKKKPKPHPIVIF